MKSREFSSIKHNVQLEFAQITDRNDFFYQNVGKIKVYGGGEDGNLSEHNPPHFHVELNDDKEVRIIIPDNIDDVITSMDAELNSKFIDDLKKWFMLPFKMDKNKNNYQALKVFWNTLNDGDDKVDKI